MDYWYRKDGDTTQGLIDLWTVTGGGIRLMVEVGAADGGSVCVWKSLCPDLQIVAVDPWIDGSGYGENIFQAYLENVAVFPDVAHIRMTSLDAAPLFCPHSLDFVYVDSVHTYEAMSADIDAWLPKIKAGGWFGGHDYTKDFTGLMQAVDEAHTGTLYTFADTSFAWGVPA